MEVKMIILRRYPQLSSKIWTLATRKKKSHVIVYLNLEFFSSEQRKKSTYSQTSRLEKAEELQLNHNNEKVLCRLFSFYLLNAKRISVD
jgi:hypothetical protein